MKRNLLKLALCAMALLPLAAWADNTWTFTWSDGTKTALQNSVVSSYWTLDGQIYYYNSTLSNAALDYLGSDLASNLTFTTKASKRIGFRYSALALFNPTINETLIHLPLLSADDIIEITSSANSSNYLKPTDNENVEAVEGEAPKDQKEQQTYQYKVKTAGSYNLTVNAETNTYVNSIVIKRGETTQATWDFSTLLSSDQQTEIANSLAWTAWNTNGYYAPAITGKELADIHGSKLTETADLTFTGSNQKIRVGTGGSYENVIVMQDGTSVTVPVQQYGLVIFNSKGSSSASNFSGDGNTSTGISGTNTKRFVVTGDVTSCTFTTTSTNLTSIQYLSPKVVTLSHNFATFSNNSGYDMEIKTDGVVAYAVTGKDGSGGVALEEYTNNVIPNGQGVILYSTSASSCIIGFTEKEPVSVSENYLTAVTTDATSVTDGYVLAYNKTSGKIVFRKVDSTHSATLNADKAYLSSSIDASPARLGSFTLPFDDETTGISNINAVSGEKQEYYTLQGTKVNQLSKGIYVVNGKKVIIK